MQQQRQVPDRVRGLDEVARIKDVIDLANELMARHIHARHIHPLRKWWWRVTGRYAVVARPIEPQGQKATGTIDAAGNVVKEEP